MINVYRILSTVMYSFSFLSIISNVSFRNTYEVTFVKKSNNKHPIFSCGEVLLEVEGESFILNLR